MKRVLLIFIILSVSWISPGLRGAAGNANLGETGQGPLQKNLDKGPGRAVLLQIRSESHVLGFHPDRAYLAGNGFVLIEEFVNPLPERPDPRLMEAGISDRYPGRARVEPSQPRVIYPELWKGISAVYEGRPGALGESTYMVKPGSDVEHIRLRYNMRVKKMPDGSLTLDPGNGRGSFRQTAPVAWQEIDGWKLPVPVEFRVIDDRTVGYRVAAYNPRHTLIIDPVYQWHTFYGSGYDDQGQAIALDEAGNIYVAGTSQATWLGDGNTAPKHAHSGGADLVVMKLNSAGVYQWHTFYGSTGADEGRGIALDASGNIYVVGQSAASWQADKKNPIHTFSGGSDIVVLKLNSSGVYQWHTFYGGPGTDGGNGLRVGGNGMVYVTGTSTAAWYGDGGSASGAPLHPFTAGSGSDLLALKLNSSGIYQWHTFYGSPETDEGRAISVDAGGNVFVIGTSLETWPGAGNEDPLSPHQGGIDITVLKLAANGTYLWHTFLGSAGDDTAQALAVDESGRLLITGTSDASWLGEGGRLPLHAHSGAVDLFVLKLTGNGAYEWHTFYGPGNEGAFHGIALDGGGHIYITGPSSTAWLGPAGESPRHLFSGTTDLVVLKLSPAGAYHWHSFYGSGFADYGTAVAADAGGRVQVVGTSNDSWLGDGEAVPIHAAHSGAPEIAVLQVQGAVSITLTAMGIGAGVVSSSPSGIHFSYPASASGQAWFEAYVPVTLWGSAEPGFKSYWKGTCAAAGGSLVDEGTVLAGCQFSSLSGGKTATVTFANLISLPLILSPDP